MHMVLFALLGGMLSFAGCGEPSSANVFVGHYPVMISSAGLSDPDLLTITEGSGDALLLSFDAGITAMVGDAGLRATRGEDGGLSIGKQTVQIDHSTGSVQGTVTGSGTVNGSALTVTLHFLGADGTKTDYQITGTRDLSSGS